MKFIVLLTCIAINRYWVGSHPLHTEEWFGRIKSRLWVKPVEALGLRWGAFIFVVLLPVVCLALLLWAIKSWFWGLLWMALSFLVLGYAIGVSSLDDTARIHTLWLRKLTPESDLETAKAQHTEVMGKLVHDEFVSIYPILFWFLLLGPAGALLYRLTDQFRRSGDLNEDESRLVNSLLHAMDWLPVRISGLAFCVVGDFGRCLDRVLGFFSEWKLQARQVLSEMVEVAITDIEVSTDGVIHFAAKAGFQVSEVRGLFHRTLMFWIALIAVITLLGWV